MKNEQIEGEKEQVWEVGDFVKETWEDSPDKDKAYKILKVEGDGIYYERDGMSYTTKDTLILVKAKDLFSKSNAEIQIEEWQPKWGEEVEGVYIYETSPVKSVKGKYLGKSNYRDESYIESFEQGNIHIYPCVEIKQPLEVHEFTTEQAKQDLAKLHNLNPEQIKITE